MNSKTKKQSTNPKRNNTKKDRIISHIKEHNELMFENSQTPISTKTSYSSKMKTFITFKPHTENGVKGHMIYELELDAITIQSVSTLGNAQKDLILNTYFGNEYIETNSKLPAQLLCPEEFEILSTIVKIIGNNEKKTNYFSH